ncbi:hypothetical protein ID866_12158, partial [Astraeus odoratus]
LDPRLDSISELTFVQVHSSLYQALLFTTPNFFGPLWLHSLTVKLHSNHDNEDPFNNDNNNDDDDDNNDEYEDTGNGTQEEWAVQVFESLACASRKSGSLSSQAKVHEPDTFNGTDPKKLCTFLVQKDHTKVVFMQSYLKDMALEWFKPDLLSSGNPRSCPLWMDNWTEFIIELQSTFSPHNPVTDAKNQLDHLQMKENQCINKYMVEFNQLASQVRGYGNDDLCYLAQEINMHYWECKEEVQHTNKSSGTSNFPANKPGNSAPNSSKGKPTTSSNTSSSSGNANSSSPNKPKSSNGGNKSSNAASSNPNLAGKLGKDGKLTLEERK